MSLTIAVCAQNRKTITGHAGRCRRFQIFECYSPEDASPQQERWVELAIDETLHHADTELPPQLKGIDLLVTKELKEGLQRKLKRLGVESICTEEDDPELAIQEILSTKAANGSSQR